MTAVLIFFLETVIVSETSRPITVSGSTATSSIASTTQGSTGTIFETDIITSIAPTSSQTPSTAINSLSTTQTSTQQSSLPAEEG